MKDDGEESPKEEMEHNQEAKTIKNEEIRLSMFALIGTTYHQQIKAHVFSKNKRMTVLIDSSSTHILLADR